MWAVVVLRYLDDLSEAETAAVLGCAVGSVKSQASRGLARMRAQMASERSPATTTNRLARLARARPDLVGTLSVRAGVTSDSLFFPTPTRAEVNGRLVSNRPGVAPVYVNSSAVWTPTGWKINRNGFCVALKRLGAGCS